MNSNGTPINLEQFTGEDPNHGIVEDNGEDKNDEDNDLAGEVEITYWVGRQNEIQRIMVTWMARRCSSRKPVRKPCSTGSHVCWR